MYRVLIADDEMIERTVLFRTLDKNLKGQCQIFQAENGRETLEIYEREQIQILILDIEMPGMNGIETFERMQKFSVKIPVIFLTASGDKDDVMSAIKLGAVNYLKKPFLPQELLKRVAKEFEGK